MLENCILGRKGILISGVSLLRRAPVSNRKMDIAFVYAFSDPWQLNVVCVWVLGMGKESPSKSLGDVCQPHHMWLPSIYMCGCWEWGKKRKKICPRVGRRPHVAA